MFSEGGKPRAESQTALMVAMKLTMSQRSEPEHFLIAMLDDSESALSKAVKQVRASLNLKTLRETVIQATRNRSGQPPSQAHWNDSLLSDRSMAVGSSLQQDDIWKNLDLEQQDRHLAAAFLDASIPRVQRIFDNIGADVQKVKRVLLCQGADGTKPPTLFHDSGQLNHDAFRASGRAILGLIEAEGKGLGLTRVTSPLLLFALVSREDSLLQRALRLQLVDPRKAHENLLVHLRSLSNHRFNDEFRLTRDRMQPGVVAALEQAGEFAYQSGITAIGDSEILKGLLAQNDVFVSTFLDSFKVDSTEFTHFVMQRSSADEEEIEDGIARPSLQDIERRLRTRVVGQDHVIDLVIPILKRMRFGFTRPERPMAVLLFLGNSGTGKTQVAKEIAHAMYGSEDQLIFLEMGQFGTELSKNIFVGAPPGYVGYGEGLLTNGLRDKPESVVLFDEVEKAHRSVFDALLRFLDEGQIADPSGPVRDGRRCIIVLTSNHALDALRPLIARQSETRHLPRAEREQVKQEIRKAILATGFFRPEFINRVDELVLFNTFNAEHYREILLSVIGREKQRLRAEKELDFEVDESLLDELIRQSVLRADEGARVCIKLVSDLVLAAVIEFYLELDDPSVRSVHLSITPDGDLQAVPQREKGSAR